MHCMFNFDSRPPKTAKVSRNLWDALTEAHGEEPESFGLFVTEGGFRDWMYVVEGELLEIEAGLVGGENSVDALNFAEYSVQQLQERRERLGA
jgi:hypothetical protein